MRAIQGIPTFCCSGDDSAADCDAGDSIQCVDYPASSPYAFSCGGTTITLNDMTEVAWGGAGGGISRVYKAPKWQARSASILSRCCQHKCALRFARTRLIVGFRGCASL